MNVVFTSFCLHALQILIIYFSCFAVLERALKLTATCLKFNPANYTVWNYRRQCLQNLGLTSDKAAVQNDLDLAASLGGSNPKNYQVGKQKVRMDCTTKAEQESSFSH